MLHFVPAWHGRIHMESGESRVQGVARSCSETSAKFDRSSTLHGMRVASVFLGRLGEISVLTNSTERCRFACEFQRSKTRAALFDCMHGQPYVSLGGALAEKKTRLADAGIARPGFPVASA